MSSNTVLTHRIQTWQVAVCLFVCAYIALGIATGTLRIYHWFMLLAIPGTILSGERGRKFFLDWAPLLAFWLVYDRLRLVQPLLYGRVAVEIPFSIERALFGWLANGVVPAHAAYESLTYTQSILSQGIEWAAQFVYFSHLFVAPLVIAGLWIQGLSREGYQSIFTEYVRAFTILNFSAVALYLLLPVAPPWWVTLHGMAQPTSVLVSEVNVAAAMHGPLIQAMIRNASQWFAAVPSLHGAYPVLLLLLGSRRQNRLALAGIALYGAAMWTSTVILNQHYIIDLVAGGVVAVVAWRVGGVLSKSANGRRAQIDTDLEIEETASA